MNFEACARELLLARARGTVIPPPSKRFPGFSIDDGYAVAQLLHREVLMSGCTMVGLKLGFTNAAAWRRLGLDSPFWAPIYDRTVLETDELSLAPFVAPRIEPEIVVGFASDLLRGASPIEISAAIEWAAAGFEIVQCHYPEWEVTPADAIADAGLHGVLLVGERVSLDEGDAHELANVVVELRQGNDVVAEGRGANALGGPAEAIAWLLRLTGIRGIRAGTIVTTGSLTPALAIAGGETWNLTPSGPVDLGHIRATFT